MRRRQKMQNYGTEVHTKKDNQTDELVFFAIRRGGVRGGVAQPILAMRLDAEPQGVVDEAVSRVFQGIEGDIERVLIPT